MTLFKNKSHAKLVLAKHIFWISKFWIRTKEENTAC